MAVAGSLPSLHSADILSEAKDPVSERDNGNRVRDPPFAALRLRTARCAPLLRMTA